ncbi:MAG: CrcB family protein [Pseudomonadota bacterium]
MNGVFYVALGGGLGAALRYGSAQVAARYVDQPGLWATLFVNGVGSFAMGLFLGWWASRGEPGGQPLYLFLAVGLLGGFTTYSAYAFETVKLIETGRLVEAGAYAVGTTLLCVLAFMLGAACLARGAA